MARVKDPTLFSVYFGVESDALQAAGLIDPFLDVDINLFIDPVLLEKSSHPQIRKQGIDEFRRHFQNFVRLLAISKEENDAAWKAARRQLDLREPPENGLGYGGSGRSGSSRPEDVRIAIMRTSKEIIELGANDPEMVSLMGFFEENVGADTISDFTARVITEQLASITEAFCKANSIPVHDCNVSTDHKLPLFTTVRGRKVPIVLVPLDIVRELPVANDWSEIERAALQNARIRDRVNRYLGGLARPTIADRKFALRKAAMGSVEDFDLFLAAVKDNVTSYDPNLDALGYYRLKAIFSNGFEGLKQPRTYNLSVGPQEIIRLVNDTLDLFKRHVEKGNLWEELWIEGKPKKERASQLIYYAIADAFCKANNVDISPEANMGGGPIDFKFSSGYAARVLVEMKRSGGTVVHGYEKQLEFYKDASQTEFGIFVIIDYGDLGNKVNEIRQIQQTRIDIGARASEIIVIDATPKASASKRK
ncbi:hypothetical protein [Methylocella silvestris]|uniref:Uncharacterized protein n=1 Tax=Methylocella silvestris TaxID=199596 RepID=A0A2J7TKE9_METSI|nr:hypothetical protein [Methylocella silvestris]PNG27243.1 hypothetical protein CR492_03950 [Methylocella silvestris]